MITIYAKTPSTPLLSFEYSFVRNDLTPRLIPAFCACAEQARKNFIIAANAFNARHGKLIIIKYTAAFHLANYNQVGKYSRGWYLYLSFRMNRPDKIIGDNIYREQGQRILIQSKGNIIIVVRI